MTSYKDIVVVIDFSKASSSPLNPLGNDLRQYIVKEVWKAIHDPTVSSIVLWGGAKGTFSAGADLTELSAIKDVSSLQSMIAPTNKNNTKQQQQQPPSNPSLRDVIDVIENSPKPIVAAIEGSCLGGGLELALGCQYRMASTTNKTRLGLPEVQVGLLPGAGGTQRLPRLVGLQAALQIILTGAPVTAEKAHKMKLVDELVTGDANLPHSAVEFAKKISKETTTTTLDSRRLCLKSPCNKSHEYPVAHVMLHTASLALPPKERGGLAVHNALESIRAGFFFHTDINDNQSKTQSDLFQNGLQKEGELFLELLMSAQGKAQRHAFFATRQAQKLDNPVVALSIQNHPLLSVNNKKKQVTPSTPISVGVIGAGTMGSGIAMVLLQAGFHVWLVDNAQPALDKGVGLIRNTLEGHLKRKKLSKQQLEERLHRLFSTTDMTELYECQMVVEAVIENLSVKQSIFEKLDAILPQSALLLTNTSTLDIDQIGSPILSQPASRRQGKIAGWHFFSPAHVMPLVEIVRGSLPNTTSPETIALLQLLTKSIGKIGVVVGNCDGFCGNRLLKPYGAETAFLLTERGASIQQVDNAFLHFGMALGPFQMADLAGNDVGYNIRRERGWARSKETDPVNTQQRPKRYTELGDVMVSRLGRLGQKVGKGWYDYNPAIGKGRKGMVSKEMEELVASFRTNTTTNDIVSDTEMIQRVMYPLVNEGFKCLEEGIARSPSDIDVVYLYGYGFPRWRGGPMHWADHQVGLPHVLETLRKLQQQFPTTDYFVPSRLLKECVTLGVTVEEFYKRGLHQQQQQSKL